MPSHQPNEQEDLAWFPQPVYGPGVLAFAWHERACVFCSGPTASRIHYVPAHAICWERAGQPVPPSPPLDESWHRKPQPDLPAQPDPAAEAAAKPQRPAAPEQQFARRRGTGDTGFVVDETDELADFHAELGKAARRSRRPAPTREQAAAALQRFHEYLHVDGEPLRFVSNAGRTGLVAFQWLAARFGAMVVPDALVSPEVWEITASHHVLRVLSFQDTTAPLEAGTRVTETDVHAQYLAAAHSVRLGDGEPTHRLDAAGLAEIDQVKLTRCPGYVRLATAPDLTTLAPHVQGAFSPAATGWWLPTPLAAYLIRDHDLALDLDAAVFWHERLINGHQERAHGARLARWAKLFVPGREGLMLAEHAGDPAAGRAVGVLKSCYSTFLGGLLRSTRHNDTNTLRPDWNDQVVAQAGANMLRAVDKAVAAGERPLGGLKDAVWWARPDGTRAPAGLVISTATSERPFQPGKWHLDRHAVASEALVAAHRSGHAGRFLKALIAADDARLAAEQESQ